MTAQKFFSRKEPRSFFGFMLRQNWPALVTNTIILIIFNVLFLSMSVSDSVSYYHGDFTEDSFRSVVNTLEVWRVIDVILVSFLAVLWGCTTMPYLNNKVGVHFYHSLPLTRGALYFREVLVKVVCLALPLATSCLLGLFTTWAIAGATLEVVAAFWVIFLEAMVYFLLFYSIMAFSATFTGTTFARLLAAGSIVFMPMVFLLCLSYIFNYSSQYSSVEWMRELAVEVFAPVRAIAVATASLDRGLSELFITLLCAGVFFIGGVLIYKWRKSENSGTPVLLKIPAALIKYSALFVGATVFSIIMEDFADGIVGIFLGGVIGALLALMLVNTVFNKSAKKMFSGMRGFAVFCAVFIAVFTVFGFDVIGFDTYVPSPSIIKSVEVEVFGKTYLVEDRNDIAEVVELTKDRFERSEESHITVEKSTSVVSAENHTGIDISGHISNEMNTGFRVQISFRTIGGLVFEKAYYDITDAHLPLMTLLADTEGFADVYFDMDADEITGVEFEYERWTTTKYASRAKKEYEAMRAAYNGSAYFNRPLLTTAYFQGDYTYYPYFENTTEAMDIYLRNVTSVIVLNVETGEWSEYTKKSDIEKIFSSAVLGDAYVTNFIPMDTTYAFAAFYGETSEYEFFIGRFLKDQVPTLP